MEKERYCKIIEKRFTINWKMDTKKIRKQVLDKIGKEKVMQIMIQLMQIGQDNDLEPQEIISILAVGEDSFERWMK